MSINAKPRGYLFDEVQFDSPNKSAFDLSHRSVYTAQFDYLYPILTHECLPGETYNLSMDMFFRTDPLVAPLMQDIDVKIYWFWCPNRILWRGWRKFISNGDGTIPNNSTLAGKNIMSVPFVTNFDLISRGNRSVTSVYRPSGFIRKPVNFQRKCYGSSSTLKSFTHGMEYGSLSDYLNIPSDIASEDDLSAIGLYYSNYVINHHRTWSSVRKDSNYYSIRTYSSLPFRAYNKIWYDWFRDENIFSDPNDTVLGYQTYNSPSEGWINRTVSKKLYIYDEDTNYYNDFEDICSHDALLNVGLLRKCWSKDYLTSALTNPQRGGDVILPLGDKAPLKFEPSTDGTTRVSYAYKSTDKPISVLMRNDQHGLEAYYNGSLVPTGEVVDIDVTRNTFVDLSNASSATLNSLRVANAFQKFLEKMARCGSRYVEYMMSMFDVEVPDSASNRVTLISTSRIPLQIQTNSSQEASHIGDGQVIPQGTQVANASGSGSSGFNFSTDEHGYIMGLMCIEPRALYGSSLDRTYLRRSYLDFAWPMFGNLGEQEVYGCEVCPSTNYDDNIQLEDYDETLTKLDVTNMSTFGYQSRYCEYKYKQDAIHGRMKSDYDYYTLSRFNNEVSPTECPEINRSFILLDNEDRQNIFNTTMDGDYNNIDHFMFDVHFNFKGIRPLPLYGTPSL